MVPNNPQPERKTLIIECTIDIALWLADNTATIARDETAGELFADIKNAIKQIERAINRPMDDKYCGNCPSVLDDKRRQCSTPLYIPFDYSNHQYPPEIQCWRCKITHNADVLIQNAIDSIAGLLYTAREIHEIMAEIGQPIPPRTWRWWRAQGKLINRSENTAEPMYWISDVRDLMAAKPQRATTGAAAHRTSLQQ
jgi:hypothetical protein